MKQLILLVALFALTYHAYTRADEAYLDAPYENLVHPVVDDGILDDKEGRNDVQAIIDMQTSVKSQGSRGTCSIFSATALLESKMVAAGYFKAEDLDLSEEWVEYLAMNGRTSDGYWSFRSWYNLGQHGIVSETTWPYVGQTWESANSGLAKERCGHLKETAQKSCLLGHRSHALLTATEEQLTEESEENKLYDPEFFVIRNEANEYKQKYLDNWMMAPSSSPWQYNVRNTSEVKMKLKKGEPLVVGLRFYYGAWNHSKASSLGLRRNLENWSKGIVAYPEYGSIDRLKSEVGEFRAGHSIVIVGYDDKREVLASVKYPDGTIKEKTYTGVYYFKNSWGQGSFGREFELAGKSYPGYGMITQKYAHEFGSFYQLPINQL